MCVFFPQVKAFLCSAKCCEDKNSSQSVLQGCMQNCMAPVRQAEETIKMELNQFQVREWVKIIVIDWSDYNFIILQTSFSLLFMQRVHFSFFLRYIFIILLYIWRVKRAR